VGDDFLSLLRNNNLIYRISLSPIRNNKLDQLQGMSAKMAANGIQTHARTYP